MKSKPAIKLQKGRDSKPRRARAARLEPELELEPELADEPEPVIVEGVIVEGVIIDLDEETDRAGGLAGAVELVAGLTKAAGLGGFIAGLAFVTHRAIQNSIDARQQAPAPAPPLKRCCKCQGPLPPGTPLEGDYWCVACYELELARQRAAIDEAARQAEAAIAAEQRAAAAAAAEQRRRAEAEADEQRAAAALKRAADAAAAALEAAELLSVDVDAPEAEINRAYRAHVKAEMNRGAFHAQGGDPVDHSLQINAAKQLLIERARRRAPANRS